MLGLIIGAAVNAIASAFGARGAANASTNAGQILSDNAYQAQFNQRGAFSNEVAGYNAAGVSTRALMQPAITVGQQATGSLYDAAQGTTTTAPDQFRGIDWGLGAFAGPNEADLGKSAAYQFRLAQGQKSLENSATARGGLGSANTMKALVDYGQNSASQEYQNEWTRALQGYQASVAAQGQAYNEALGTYNANLGAWSAGNQQKQQKFQDLYSLAQFGQQAATTQAGSELTLSQLVGTATQRNAELNASYAGQGASAKAAAVIGKGNIWQAYLSSLGNNLQGAGALVSAGYLK
jgi:hypothetical protein